MIVSKKITGLLALLSAVLVLSIFGFIWEPYPGTYSEPGVKTVSRAYSNQQNGVAATVSGEVSRILLDDNERMLKQKFVVRLTNGQAVLVEHIVRGSERVPLTVGDQVTISGRYYWSEPGGVMRWTSQEDGPGREDGWVEHQGRRYD